MSETDRAQSARWVSEWGPRYWRADRAIPTLLVERTMTGSGRRLVLLGEADRPFDLSLQEARGIGQALIDAADDQVTRDIEVLSKGRRQHMNELGPHGEGTPRRVPPPHVRVITGEATPAAIVRLTGVLGLRSGPVVESCYLEEDGTAAWRLVGGFVAKCSYVGDAAHWSLDVEPPDA